MEEGLSLPVILAVALGLCSSLFWFLCRTFNKPASSARLGIGNAIVPLYPAKYSWLLGHVPWLNRVAKLKEGLIGTGLPFWRAFREGWPVYKVLFLPPFLSSKNSGLVVVSDSHLIEQTMKGKDFGISSFLSERFGYAYGRHVMIAIGGEEWKRHRRIIAPIFHRQHVQYAMDVVVGHTREFIGPILQKAAQSDKRLVLDMRKPLNGLTMKIGADVAFGYGLTEEQRDRFGKHYTTIDQTLAHIFGFRFPVSVWKLFHPGLARKLKEARMAIQKQVILPIIRKRREGVARGDATERYDLLSLMLQATDDESAESQCLTEEELVQEALMLFQAGFDTLTSTCLWVFYRIAKHPDVQEKAYEEIAKMMDAEDGRPDFDAVNSLTYLSQVIKETQRLHPILPFLSRDATKDTTIGDYKIHEGQTVMIGVYNIHHSPEEWDDPEDFKPSRWRLADGGCKKSSGFSFLGFSAGNRRCIGQPLAGPEMRAILSIFVHNFRFELVEEVAIGPGLIMAPSDVTLRLTCRK